MSRSIAFFALLLVALLLGGTTPATAAGCEDVLALASPSLAATVTVKGFLIPFVGAKKVTYSGKLTPGVSGNLTAPSGIIVAFPNVTGLGCNVTDSLITTGKPATDLKALNAALKTTDIGALDYIMSMTDASGAYETKAGTFNNTKKDYTKITYLVQNLQFALFSGSAKLGFAPVAIKVGSKKTLGLYANITAGTIDVVLDYYRINKTETTATVTSVPITIDATELSVKSIAGCSLQLRKKVPADAAAPPDFFLDCSKIKITLNKYKETDVGVSDFSAEIVLVGTGFTAQAPVSAVVDA